MMQAAAAKPNIRESTIPLEEIVRPQFSAFNDVLKDFPQPSCPVPTDVPPFVDMSDQEPVFDPDVHLALDAPERITLLDFTEAKVAPPVKNNTQSMLAYTAAFRILSDEGVRVLRAIIDRNAHHIQSSERQPTYLRGLAYTSKFIRDLNNSPRLLELLSSFAGQRVEPHYMPMNYAHINIGKLPKDPQLQKNVPVDQWHCDSVPFVLIIILSDMTDMVGGELQCVKRKGKKAGFDLIEQTGNNVDAKDLLNVSYERQGYGLFMQGSEIVHHVTGVVKAREPRITLVNSYMPSNTYAEDRTVYATFLNDKEPQATAEFARGRAWRAAHQLLGLMNEPYTSDAKPYADHLSRVVSELQMTVALLEQRASDTMDYYHEVVDAAKESEKKEESKTVDESKK